MATDTEFSKALTLHRSGCLAEAESLYRNILEMHAGHPGALHLLGLIEISKKNHDGAVRLIRRSIETGGPNAMRLNDLGSACRAAGDLNEAADSFRSALNLKTDLTPAWLGLAGVLREQGRLADAIDTLEEGRQLVPRGASLDFNLATLMAESGDFERAAIAFGSIFDDDPGQIAASLSLGRVLGRLEKSDEAEAVYRRSLESVPGNADLLNAIAEIRMDSGQPDSAERLLRQALENHPGHVIAWFNLGKTLLSAGRLDADFLARWLSVDGPVPGIVRRAGIEHVRRLTEFGRMADRVASADSRLRDLPGLDCARELMANPVLGLLLEKVPVDDLVLEGMLRSLRRACLLSPWADSAGERSQSESLAFLISLAQQCFHNEYIYEVEPDEAEALARLRETVEHGQATTVDMALLATYMPLFQLERDLLPWFGNHPQGKVELQSLLRQQVSEPLEERELASGIESISGIEDAVSLAVRGQYEDNPYPRWHAIGRLDTHPVGLILSGLFPFLSARQTVWPQSPDILVAGCGTGHQSIASAQRFANCHVTAIDLSLASLAYAKRKTRQAGIPNIDYRQGDILELADLEDRFDIIECTGVLHHMADPLAGWRVLRDLLTPGGLMKIGLYSELGRESIVAARTLVEREGFAANAEGIRAARKLIGSLPAEDPARQVTERPDFYTMSTCRDLIFHVQEHRLTLPRISEMCEALELEFLGFELPSSDIATSFRSRFPDDPHMRSLANWDRFERDNKGAFSRMYLFWVRDSQSTA